MPKKLYNIILLLLLAGLILTACGGETAQTTPVDSQGPAEAKIKVCQVTDAGGIDDKSFNATSWKGVLAAVDQLGVEGKYLESQQQTDYEKNISEFLNQDYNGIITVGFLMADATKAASENSASK